MKYFALSTAAGMSLCSSLSFSAGISLPTTNEIFDSARPVDFGETIAGALLCDDTDYYSFEVSGQPQLIKVNGFGYENAFIFKVDQGLTALFGEQTPMEQASASDGGEFQFVADAGTYYFRISEGGGWCKEKPTPHEFTITTQPAPFDDRYEYDTDFADMLSLEQSATLTGSLWNHDWRKITIPQGYNGFEIELNQQSTGANDENQPWVVVWDAQYLTEVARTKDYTSSAKAGFIEPGDYYVLVTSSTGSFDGDQYQINWQPIVAKDDVYEFNNTRKTAAVIAPSQPIIAVHWDDDWYEIDVTEGQTDIAFRIEYPDSHSQFRLQLTDALGTKLYRWTTQLQDTASLEKTYSLPKAGKYYLQVINETNAAGADYNLRWDAQ